MTDIQGFLEARIAADEETATRACDRTVAQWEVYYEPGQELGEYRGVRDGQAETIVEPLEHTDAAQAAHIACWDPDRIFAECTAKREILNLHSSDGQHCRTCGVAVARFPCRTLRVLASPYDSHPDYDRMWTP